MTALTQLELKTMPSATAGFLKAALARRGGLKDGDTLPRIEAILRGLRVSNDRVRRYAALCGYTNSDHICGNPMDSSPMDSDHMESRHLDNGYRDSDYLNSGDPENGYRALRYLPPTYPHVLAAPMHLKVLTHPRFPLRLPGLVQVRSDLRQHRPIGLDEVLSVQVYVDGHREVRRGLEFDLCTHLRDRGGETLWESESVYLLRRRGADKPGQGGGGPDLAGLAPVESWRVPADIGRRYGFAAGDVNPIHLHWLAARLFGFPRAIAHGMWSFARCIAALSAGEEPAALRANVAFRKPIPLPSNVVLRARREGGNADYAVTDDQGRTIHLTGRLERI